LSLKKGDAENLGEREKQSKELFQYCSMHGDLEGLAGTALPQIKILELSIEDKKDAKDERLN